MGAAKVGFGEAEQVEKRATSTTGTAADAQELADKLSYLSATIIAAGGIAKTIVDTARDFVNHLQQDPPTPPTL